MNRRSFLRNSSIASLPLFLNGFPVNALNFSPFNSISSLANDKVLILIQLNGGNDGLNTLIPLDKYSLIHPHRSNVIIPENKILKINDESGLHPSMDKAQILFQEGKMSAILNVGHPEIDLSHFRSQEKWLTGFTANEEALTTGWLGRFLDQTHPTFPQGYPNSDFPDPFAITLGAIVSETCEGIGGTYSMALSDPDDLKRVTEIKQGTNYPENYQDLLNFVNLTISLSNSYSENLSSANELGINYVEYPETDLAQQLKIVARLIAGGTQTKIYVLNLGGFDTHISQVDNSDPTRGAHANLLKTISDGIYSFQMDLEASGNDHRVMGMIYSEFGRRIKSNSKTGTDHGVAAPMFLFGSCVKQPIFGNSPHIPDEIAVNTSVPYEIHFLSVYGSILRDWFGAEESLIGNVFSGEDFNFLPILNQCNNVVTNSSEPVGFTGDLKVYPNPASQFATLEIDLPEKEGIVTIRVLSMRGKVVKILLQRRLDQGNHNIPIEIADLPAGTYIIQAIGNQINRQAKFQKF